jgi:type IV pilus assembly protein PilA
MNKNHKYPAKGFTLVEIMIVVVIIGLLAAMAIPAFNKIRFTARYKAVVNNLRQVSSGAQQYLLEQGASQVLEPQLEGTSSFNYIRPVSTINQETYSGFTIVNSTTQLSTSQIDGTIVTFNM